MNDHPTNLNDASEANLHAVDYWQVIRTHYGIIILTTLLVFITALVITKIIPKKYKSYSLIEVHYPQTELDPLANVGGAAIQGIPASRYYMETQIKLITSERTLTEVVEELDLVAQWNAQKVENAISIIRSVTRVTPEAGTDLVKIEVEHKDKEESKELAQTIAYSYKKQREEEEAKRIDEMLGSLNKILQTQQDIVEEKRSMLTHLTRAAGVTKSSISSDGSIGQNSAAAHKQAFMELDALQKEKQKYESQITALKGKSDASLIQTAIGLKVVDSLVPQLYTQYIESDRALTGFRESGYGENHPKMVSAIKTHNQLLGDLYSSVQDLRVSLDANLERVNRDINTMKSVVEQGETKAINEQLAGHEYEEAKRDYDQAKSILDRMHIEQVAQGIKIKSPKITITMHETAKLPSKHSFPNDKLNLIIGGVLGGVLGIGLAFFLEFVDSSVKSLDDVERYLQLPVLAVIPKDIELLHQQGGNSPDAEAYRILRTNIEFNKRRNPGDNCITVVSGGAGEGKSTTLINLAYVCAQGGYSTLIIDADLRRPRLHTYFDINNSIGLSNYLTSDLQLEDVILQTPTENLYFMSSGVVQADPAGILNSNRMSGLISDVKERFDLVLIDSPPILGVSDASVISSEADQTMIVIQHRKLPRNILLRVKQSVENVGGNILGVVLNNVDIRSDSQYQYYTSYYTYYSGDETPQTVSKVYGENEKKDFSMNENNSRGSNKEDSLY